MMAPWILTVGLGLCAGLSVWLWGTAKESDAVQESLRKARPHTSMQKRPAARLPALLFASLAGLILGSLIRPGSPLPAALGALMGFLAIGFIARQREKKRIWNRFRSFPDFLDLLALGMSSGLTLEAAWRTALDHLSQGELKKELQKTQRVMQLGQTKATMLEELSARLQDDRLSPVLSLMVQSIKRGSPLDTVLLQQADSLRTTLMFSLEKRAQTAATRLMFPVLLFIFPTVFLILLGPLALQYMRTGSLF